MGTRYDDEPPLDPVLEKVRRKLVRRMAWSLGIMMLGLMAVLGAIVYKINALEHSSDILSAQQDFIVDIPDDAIVVSTALDDDTLLVTVELSSGGFQLISIDRQTGEVTSKINMK